MRDRCGIPPSPPARWFAIGMFQFMTQVCSGQFEKPPHPFPLPIGWGEGEYFWDVNPG
jgi:hypothetical protein